MIGVFHMGDNVSLNFSKSCVVYIPCYNCAKTILRIIGEIPREIYSKIDVVVVDNHSSDGTLSVLLTEIEKGQYPFNVHVIEPEKNVGYSGSQKLMYQIAINSHVKKVIMLHGDGQYPSEMIKQFIPYLESDYGIVNGYRSKKAFPEKEETPMMTYCIIKLLSAMESVFLGINQKEWHSGLVMYDVDFLRKIPLQELSPYMHIDGEFLMCAHLLKEKTLGVPIYKRYKEFPEFGGWGRVKHILHVFKLIGRYWSGYYRKLINSQQKPNVTTQYTIKGQQYVQDK